MSTELLVQHAQLPTTSLRGICPIELEKKKRVASTWRAEKLRPNMFTCLDVKIEQEGQQGNVADRSSK